MQKYLIDPVNHAILEVWEINMLVVKKTSRRSAKLGSGRQARHAKLGNISIDSNEKTLLADFLRIRKSQGLTQPEMARLTGYSVRSIASWEAGHAINAAASRRLTSISRLCNALANIMPQQSVGNWLRAANSAFEGQTPMQLIERGESDRIWEMIHQINANVAS